ncbi:hypothetical protein NEIPOLOT_02405 [Neisseria polysaccharea ATCC 43768]|nr:hypothetical protein NEIPOLOT_02405 [Neisseria polysaccharea ATCC 43768]
MDAVEADVADFAFEFADVFYFSAQAAAEAVNLAGGEADFQKFVGDGIAVGEIVFVPAVVFFQTADHFFVVFFDLGKVADDFLFQFGEIGCRDFIRIFFRLFVVFVFIRIVVGRFLGHCGFQVPQAQFVEQYFIRVDNGFYDFVDADFVFADFFR